jgi:hypothetical protein
MASPTFAVDELSLVDNEFTEEELLKIVALFKTNPSLKTVIISGNPVTPAIISSLCDTLLYNKRISRVTISPDDFSHINVNCLIDIRRTLDLNTNVEFFSFGEVADTEGPYSSDKLRYCKILDVVNKPHQELCEDLLERMISLINQNDRFRRWYECPPALKLLCIVRMCVFNVPWEKVGNEVRHRKTVYLPLELWLQIFSHFESVCHALEGFVDRVVEYALSRRTLVKGLTKRKFLQYVYDVWDPLEELILYN